MSNIVKVAKDGVNKAISVALSNPAVQAVRNSANKNIPVAIDTVSAVPGKVSKTKYGWFFFYRPKAYAVKKWPLVRKYLVELQPPSISEMGTLKKEIGVLKTKALNGSWKQITVFQATVNFFVAVEVIAWFFIGEILGKGSLRGYAVEGGVFNYKAHH